MSLNKGIRSASRRNPFAAAMNEKKRQEHVNGGSTERKMRSLQSLQERLCFTLKRPRSRRHKKGGPNSGYGVFTKAHPHKLAGTSTLVESGLIQIPHLQCEYYESPSTPLSLSSCFSQDSIATTTTATTTSSGSSITHVSATHSPLSSLEYNSSDDSFSCDEVMSLVSCCPDMLIPNVLDFMPYTTQRPADMCGATAGRPVTDICEAKATTLEQGKIECPPSSVEDDVGEQYRIDLCDFEPDVNALNSPPQDGANHQKNYGGGVLCLRLDYEEVLRAWKERGECLISREPMYYPSPYLDPLHIFGYTRFVPHSPFFQ